MRDKGVSNSRGGLVGQWSEDNKTTKVVDTNKDVDRALGTVWELQKVDTNDIEWSVRKRIFKNRSCFCSTFRLSTRDAL